VHVHWVAMDKDGADTWIVMVVTGELGAEKG
jgi:hypothetical protein